MIEVEEFEKLYERYQQSDDQGWIMIEKDTDIETVAKLMNAKFTIADDESEEKELSKVMDLFLEIPTFQDIIMNEHEANRTSMEDVAKGCLYYLERDTFRD